MVGEEDAGNLEFLPHTVTQSNGTRDSTNFDEMPYTFDECQSAPGDPVTRDEDKDVAAHGSIKGTHTHVRERLPGSLPCMPSMSMIVQKT